MLGLISPGSAETAVG